MSSKPKFYRLDLVNLGELFDPDVPFSVPWQLQRLNIFIALEWYFWVLVFILVFFSQWHGTCWLRGGILGFGFGGRLTPVAQEWCKKCQWAGNDGFGNNRLQDHAPNLTPLEHTERICGTWHGSIVKTRDAKGECCRIDKSCRHVKFPAHLKTLSIALLRLLYINLSGAGIVWLSLALICTLSV